MDNWKMERGKFDITQKLDEKFFHPLYKVKIKTKILFLLLQFLLSILSLFYGDYL